MWKNWSCFGKISAVQRRKTDFQSYDRQHWTGLIFFETAVFSYDLLSQFNPGIFLYLLVIEHWEMFSTPLPAQSFSYKCGDLRDALFWLPILKNSGVVKIKSMHLNLVQKLTHKMWTFIHFLHNYGLFSNGDMHVFMFRLVVPLMCLKKYTCCDSDLNAWTFDGSVEWNE